MSPDKLKRGKILVSKVGLDGHDRGVKVLARMLRDEGFDVVALGIRQTPRAVAEVAKANNVDVVGLSILSGAHVGLSESVRKELDALGCHHITLAVGGVIPREDAARLESVGVCRAFHPGDAGIEPSIIANALDELVALAHAGGSRNKATANLRSEKVVPFSGHRVA